MKNSKTFLAHSDGRRPVQLSNGDFGMRATLAAEIRITSEKEGLVEYIASDETIDSYREIIRVEGWKFDQFAKNSPFVDTHNYYSIDKLLGKVVDWKIDRRNRRLVETVQWAKDVKENELAQLGWAMLTAGFGPKAVSVGFYPEEYVSRWDANDASKRPLWMQQLTALGLDEATNVRCIYIKQQQIELSACILGANPNALQMSAKAYKAGVLNDEQLEMISRELAPREPATDADSPGDATAAQRQAQERFSEKLRQIAARL
jgi:hypothetical protein